MKRHRIEQRNLERTTNLPLDLTPERQAELIAILNCDLYDRKVNKSSATSGTAQRLALLYLWAVGPIPITSGRIAEMIGCGKATTQNALKSLRDTGVIEPGEQTGSHHLGVTYTIHFDRLSTDPETIPFATPTD